MPRSHGEGAPHAAASAGVSAKPTPRRALHSSTDCAWSRVARRFGREGWPRTRSRGSAITKALGLGVNGLPRLTACASAPAERMSITPSVNSHRDCCLARRLAWRCFAARRYSCFPLRQPTSLRCRTIPRRVTKAIALRGRQISTTSSPSWLA